MLNYPLNVTLDTNVIDETKYDFSDDSVLSILERYVKQGKVKVSLSDIVIGEVKSHCGKAAQKVYSTIRNSVSDIQKIKCRSFAERFKELPVIHDKKRIIAEGETFLQDLVKKLDVYIIPCDGISINEIFDDYFKGIPPFAEEGRKKYEFPDAVISKQIKQFFSDGIVYVISKDKGLRDSLKDTSNVLLLDSIGDLHIIIAKEEKDYQNNLSVINGLKDKITTQITEYFLEGNGIELIGGEYDRKGFYEGIYYEETSIDNVDYLDVKSIDITYFDKETICSDIVCEAEIQATGSYMDYENSQWDSEDGEYLYQDWHSIVEKHHVQFMCQISIQKESPDIEIIDLNVVLSPTTKIGELIIPSEKDLEDEEFARLEELEALESNAIY